MQYVGLQRSISTAEMEQCVGEDFGRLMPLFHQKGKALQAGAPFSIYHKFDVVRKKGIYTAALPLTEIPTDLESDMITGTPLPCRSIPYCTKVLIGILPMLGRQPLCICEANSLSLLKKHPQWKCIGITLRTLQNWN